MSNTDGDFSANARRDKGAGGGGWASGGLGNFQGGGGQMAVCPTSAEVRGPTPNDQWRRLARSL